MLMRLLVASLLLITTASLAEIVEEVVEVRTYTETYTEVITIDDGVETITITEGEVVIEYTEAPAEQEYFYTNDVFEQNETYAAITADEPDLDEYYTVEVYGEEPDIYVTENDIITEDHDGLSEYQGRTIYIEEDDVTHEQIKADDALGQWEKRKQKWT